MLWRGVSGEGGGGGGGQEDEHEHEVFPLYLCTAQSQTLGVAATGCWLFKTIRLRKLETHISLPRPSRVSNCTKLSTLLHISFINMNDS